jgi:hypothetical protein
MSTPRRIRANRENARASTGPRTKAGKARASRNARRHGLSVSVTFDPALFGQVEALARRIVEETAPPEVGAMARRFAEAQVDLDRIRQVRRHLARAFVGSASGDRDAEPSLREQMRQLRILDRYERRALARRKAAAKAFDRAFVPALRFRGPPSSPGGTAPGVHGESPSRADHSLLTGERQRIS